MTQVCYPAPVKVTEGLRLPPWITGWFLANIYQELQLGLSRAHLTSVFSPPWIRLCAWMRKESLQEVLVETEVEWTTDIHGFIYNCLYGFLGLNVSLPASLLQKGLQLCVVMALPLANIDAHMSDLWLWRRIF
ncbi:uncharacterized protein [Aegilops tauschii subsp. strangulata]|uniref:uncharacterized protein isoform X2 n=1 Tax=Aegilops tauschii subsp. strangulata TaxID=200361 RepID=UPI001ABC2D29|nr:uncharacterized protein LOC120976292 isoform X2 [Aegilops tauschii subsp. strangulata]